jgi:aminoglycoside phosphotransferase (APT) family kinase protein
MERLRPVWAAVPEAPRARLAAVLADVPQTYTGSPVLCHADIAPEHLLADATGAQFLGLIDFGDLMLSDPASDLAGAYLLGGARALESALREYPHAPDAGLFGRARFFAACRIADDLAYGLGDGRPTYVRAALRALDWL